MKILKINTSGIAEYSIDGVNYSPISEIGKDEIYTIIRQVILDSSNSLLFDDPTVSTINNEAHKIIYSDLYSKVIELVSKRVTIVTAVENEIKPVREKYNLEVDITGAGTDETPNEN